MNISVNNFYLAWDSPMICASLPESPRKATDLSNDFFFAQKVSFPNQRPITKNPHI